MTPRQAKAALELAHTTANKLREQLQKREAATRKLEREISDMVEVKKTSASYTFTRKRDGLKVWMTATNEWPTVYWHKNGKQTKQIAKGIDANASQMNWVSHVVSRLATYTK
jgi:ribosomal protein S13